MSTIVSVVSYEDRFLLKCELKSTGTYGIVR